MSVELRQEDFEAFFQAPQACYGRGTWALLAMRGDLKRALSPANPLFQKFARRTWFTAHRDGRVCGRVLAHIHDTSNKLHNLKRGYFGFFDCIDDLEVARSLMQASADWVRSRGCTEIAGNFNLTITQVIGVVTEGFDGEPYSYQHFNPPHVARLLDELGFERFFPMQTYEVDLQRFDPNMLLGRKQQTLLNDARWSFVPIRRRGLKQRLLEACEVLNDGFRHNSLFVPLTPEEFLYPCEDMTWVIDETLSYTAYENGRPVGVALCIPDLNPIFRKCHGRMGPRAAWEILTYRWKRTRAAIIFFSVAQNQQSMGVNGAMLFHMTRALKAGGYTHLGVSWVSESNGASRRQMEKLGAQPLHCLHLFRKKL